MDRGNTTPTKYDEVHLAQLYAARARAEQSRTPVKNVQPRVPEPRANYWSNLIKGAFPTVAPHIAEKIERAVQEGRISEATVATTIEGAKHARNPGGYFVAVMKKRFAEYRLTWETETWE